MTSLTTGVATLVLGLIVLLGWYTDNRTLIQVVPTFVPTQYNTALGFVFSGAALLCLLLGRLRLARIAGCLVLLVGGLTLVEYITGVNLGIDELFMKHEITVKTSQAEGSAGRLRRIAREPGASAMERSMAENFAFKVFLDLIGKLQSLGYLPRIPTGVVTQVVGASGDVIPTLDQLARRIEELDLVDQELGVRDPESQQRRRMLKEVLERGRTAAEIQRMLEKMGGN